MKTILVKHGQIYKVQVHSYMIQRKGRVTRAAGELNGEWFHFIRRNPKSPYFRVTKTAR